jgi:RimJ/RimL family protein N-acetyltransferase
MHIELMPFVDEHAMEVASWPSSALEAMAWAGPSTPFPVPPIQFRGWHDDPDVHPFSGSLAGNIVAYGELWIEDWEDEIELARIIVEPAYRGVGVGQKFVAALVTHALTFGLRNLFVRVVPANEIAIHCYKGAGFVAVPPEDLKKFNLGQPVAYEWLKQSARRPQVGQLANTVEHRSAEQDIAPNA